MAVATACMLLALVAPGVAHPPDNVDARSAESSALTGSQLPTVRQVARRFPEYAGGTRQVRRSRTVQLFAPNCVYYTAGPRAVSGRWASYGTADGGPPYPDGGVGVNVFAFEFPGKRAALRSLRALRRDVSRCIGTKESGTFLRRRVRLDAPRLGTARPLAWSEVFRETYGDGDFRIDRARYLWTVDGPFLVRTAAFKERSMPPLRPFLRLSRVATRVVR